MYEYMYMYNYKKFLFTHTCIPQKVQYHSLETNIKMQ